MKLVLNVVQIYHVNNSVVIIMVFAQYHNQDHNIKIVVGIIIMELQ